jgi:hypothetical protein
MFIHPTTLGIYAEARMAEARQAPKRPVTAARRPFRFSLSVVIPHYFRHHPLTGASS